MKRAMRLVGVLCLVLAACGGDASTESTTIPPDASTLATSTTIPASTTTMPEVTTTPPTTVPGSYPIDYDGFCVRGTDPSDQLNVRSGPGADHDIIGSLAFNATGIVSTGVAAPDAQGRAWFEIGFEDGTGWSAGWYLIPEPCDAAVAAPAPLSTPGFLDALSGGLVPWEWVDEQWVLFKYWPGSGQAYALYMLSPQGDLYEMYEWDDSEIGQFFMLDWRPDGRALLVGADLASTSYADLLLFDLPDRNYITIHTTEWANEFRASFTRPTGRDIVLDTNHATRERIEVRQADGSLFSVLVDRPLPPIDEPDTTWLYGMGGTTVVVGDGDGLRLLDNHGTLIRELDSPGVNCKPVHWWDASNVVAGCTPQEVIDAVPISIYQQLWQVPLSGAAATALTQVPTEIPIEVDFGYLDFIRAEGGLYAQWAGDCGAGGRSLVGARDDGIVVFQWTPCWDAPFSLDLASVAGGIIRNLIPDGVVEAIMIRDVP